MNDINKLSDQSLRIIEAGIAVILVLTGVMLLALFTRTPPHPPIEVAPFALAPFLGSSIAIGSAALFLLRCNTRIAGLIVIVFILTALISFGPQKYFDPNFSKIWPAVICAQLAIISVVANIIVTVRNKNSRGST